MVIPQGIEYANQGSSSWQTASSDITVSFATNYGIKYYPAIYYVVSDTGSYNVKNASEYTISGNCASPSITHYGYLERRPGSFSSSSGIAALGPDGQCLRKVEIQPTDAEMQNFANWFSYYRKRHLALRAGMGQAFNELSSVRVGWFPINNRTNVTMLDMDTDRNTLVDKLYDIIGNYGGTPNRESLDFAGQQYKRTDGGAPITASCQKNFTLQFTDGYSALDAPPVVGNQDYSKGAPYNDGYSNTLGDIAMKYYTENLRPTLSTGDVPVADGCSDPTPDARLDCNANLHMNTYTIGLGAQGSIFGVTHQSVADAYASSPSWPNVNLAEDLTQIDDLYHAAVNGRGDIFNANTTYELQNALQAALRGIVANVGSASSATVNASAVQTDSQIYQALFHGGRWTGALRALALHNGSGNNGCSTADLPGTVCPNEVWNAGTLLDAQNLSSNPRQMISYNGSAGIPFEWNNLSITQQTALNLDVNGTADTLGQDRLDYLRGDRLQEESNGGPFRNRKNLLGDIVHSSPLFVEAPFRRYATTWLDNLGGSTAETAYDTFISTREGINLRL
jgi:type IV pilus assembly protein PilY1